MLSRRVTAPAGVRVSGRGANGLLRGEYGCPAAWWPARAAASLGVGAADEVMLTRALGCTFSLLSGPGGLRGELRLVRAQGTPHTMCWAASFPDGMRACNACLTAIPVPILRVHSLFRSFNLCARLSGTVGSTQRRIETSKRAVLAHAPLCRPLAVTEGEGLRVRSESDVLHRLCGVRRRGFPAPGACLPAVVSRSHHRAWGGTHKLAVSAQDRSRWYTHNATAC